MNERARIEGIFTGTVQDRWPTKPPSAIAKTRRDGPVSLGATGFLGDAQADLAVHGGRGKAVHVYPVAHYARWRRDLGDRAAFAPGGFGENVAVADWTEADVCIGDVMAMGTARVAISQGRQPCWKLSAHVGEDSMAYRVRKTRRTGWYLRVLEGGAVAEGDEMVLLERPNDVWTVHRVATALFDPRADPDDVDALAGMADLDPSWRGVFAERRSEREAVR
ncbi:MOSC domain-containing protein [Jannaschia sp. KMU-145]|uniref:MOSC domain-containing protein n=1 Tax=Jannaschia halovivens TaxID=3388667 RepID=UPI00396AFCC0